MVYAAARLSIPSSDEYSVPQPRDVIREVELLIGRTLNADEWGRL
jgi:hypothetical protein